MKFYVRRKEFELAAGYSSNFCCPGMEELFARHVFNLSNKTGVVTFYKDSTTYDVYFCPNCGKRIKYEVVE
jgi:hypothetical protein